MSVITLQQAIFQDESSEEFHIRRARQELDLAYRCALNRVAEIHLLLSSLHMQRLRALRSGSDPRRHGSQTGPVARLETGAVEHLAEAPEFETVSG